MLQASLLGNYKGVNHCIQTLLARAIPKLNSLLNIKATWLREAVQAIDLFFQGKFNLI